MKIVTLSRKSNSYKWVTGSKQYNYIYSYALQMDEKVDLVLETFWSMIKEATNEKIKKYEEREKDKLEQCTPIRNYTIPCREQNFTMMFKQDLCIAQVVCLGKMLRPELNWDSLEKLIDDRFYCCICSLKKINELIKKYFIEEAEYNYEIQRPLENPSPLDIFFSKSSVKYHCDLNKANELRKALNLSNQSAIKA